MHELSIAQSILDLARAKTPPDCLLRRVHVRAGPMRAIDPEALQLAWSSLPDTSSIELLVDLLPWRLRCPDCSAEHDADDLYSPCSCGSSRCFPVGGDELSLCSIDVDDPIESCTP